MSRGPATFKQSDLERALKVAEKAGLPVRRFEIDRNGKIIIVAGEPDEANTLENEWNGVR